MDNQNLTPIIKVLALQEHLEFAVLVGSRATGTEHSKSDWDIALQWTPQFDWFAQLGETETLRHTLAQTLATAPESIDLIELKSANLAMRASVANEGIPLVGKESIAWARFLQRTWRELEDFEWGKRHAA